MKKELALVLALALALSLAACGGSPAPASSSAAGSTSTAQPAASGTMTTNGLYPGTADPEAVTYNAAAEPGDMNSVTTTDSVSISIMRDTMEGLTSLDQNSEPIPGVAETWDVSDDGTVYTFHLRDDAVWSNGEKITADDFVFAWTQLFTPETGASYGGTWASYIKGAQEMIDGTGDASGLGVKALSENTLEVTLTHPCTYFLSLTAFPNFYPINEDFWNEVGGVEKYGRSADTMLYNGPYVISEWTHEDHVTMTKNDQYWDKENKAFIPTVNVVMIADSNAAINSFQGGELDMVNLNGDQKAMFEAEGCVTAQYDEATCSYMEYNLTDGVSSEAVQKALNNAKVRTAMTLAIDSDSYNKNIAKNSNTVANGMVPEGITEGVYGEARGNLIDRSMSEEEIKALFDEGMSEAGVDVADFKPVITTDDTDAAKQFATFIQNQWKEKLGFDSSVEQITFQSRLDKQTKKTFDVIPSLWSPDYNDPMTYLDMFVTDSGNNHTGWSNAEYDELIANAMVEADADTRTQMLIDAEKILMEEMPVGPTYCRVRDYLCSDKLTGVVRSAFQETVMHFAKIAE